MGDQERLTRLDEPRGVDWNRLQRSLRFGLGLAGLFLSTVVVTLAVLAMAATLLPRWHSTVVASESMEPALRRGDVVAYSERDISDVGKDSIIVFDDDGVSIIHRVVAVNDDGTLTTRGDANANNDRSPVTATELFGAGRLVVPWIGLPRLWWLEGRYALVVLTVAAVLIALRGSRLTTGAENDPWAGTEPDAVASGWIWQDEHEAEHPGLLDADDQHTALTLLAEASTA